MSIAPEILSRYAAQRRAAVEASIGRALAAVEMYSEGKTYAEIAREYGVSRERVRQILKGIGISTVDGGRNILNAERRAKRADALNKQSLIKNGCTYEQWNQIPREIRRQYSTKRSNTVNQYGALAWAMTLWEYYLEVKKAGVEIARGRLGMTRIDRNRPFAPGNVKFAQAGSWAKQGS